MTISKIREFLQVWLNLILSDGCISNAVSEMGLAARMMTPQLLKLLRACRLLNMDETSWYLHKFYRYCWVAVGHNVRYYEIGNRTAEMARKILGEFKNTLVTDGFSSYRWYQNRGRCWPHVERKASALQESCTVDVNAFGEYVTIMFKILRRCVYKMRQLEEEQQGALKEIAQNVKTLLLLTCIKNKESTHEKTRELATELTSDPVAMFAQLKNPWIPTSNNIAERALRSIVIIRNLTYGSKTQAAADGFTAMASLIGTLHARQEMEWHIPIVKSPEENSLNRQRTIDAKFQAIMLSQSDMQTLEQMMTATHYKIFIEILTDPKATGAGVAQAKIGLNELIDDKAIFPKISPEESYAAEDDRKYHIDSLKERVGKLSIWTWIGNLVNWFRRSPEIDPPIMPEPFSRPP